MTKIVNLTPHPLEFHTIGTVPIRIESSGVARCETVETVVGEVDGIPVVMTEFGSVTGLPEPLAGTIYVVSSITAQACPDRQDVFVPARPIRDAQGRIVACAALGRVAA